MIRIDTNYIVRYFMNDNKEMADIAENILANEQVFISNEVLAEVVYVLLGVYNISKNSIVEKLIMLINCDNVATLDDTISVNALTIFKEKSIDFVDSILCAYSKYDEIKTFDKKLLKCIETSQKVD